jgi:UPF0271 protein
MNREGTRRLLLSCDTGEATTDAGRRVEDELAGVVDIVSIACGGHAGDERTMRHAAQTAMRSACAIAAHPSYPDRAGFGRVALDLPARRLTESLAEQLSMIATVSKNIGAVVEQVKPHGALYHRAASDEETAEALRLAIEQTLPGAAIVMPSGAETLSFWERTGCPVQTEAFADRRYEADGRLRDRAHDDALITEPVEAAAQARSIARDRLVSTTPDHAFHVCAAQLCVHSDTPNAVAVARAVRDALRSIEPRSRGI